MYFSDALTVLMYIFQQTSYILTEVKSCSFRVKINLRSPHFYPNILIAFSIFLVGVVK